MSADVFASACFAGALAHTFFANKLGRLASRFPNRSAGSFVFHLLGEVEVVFGLWAALYLAFLAFAEGGAHALSYLKSLSFVEPTFVFVILVICSTGPILGFSRRLIERAAALLPMNPGVSFFCAALVLGPLLGSLITEPAAMAVTALLIRDRFFQSGVSTRVKYAILGLLFVNVSIGGTLTHFAAPPVLMVAAKWGWGLAFMAQNFGWKAVLAILLSTALVACRFRAELAAAPVGRSSTEHQAPLWITVILLLILALAVISSHHIILFIGIFLFFLGLVKITGAAGGELALRQGLLVGFFLAGLVVLGGPQRWWIEPLLIRFEAFPLFAGTAMLTAVVDNAALTYLGSQVPSLSEASRYALVAGSVVGGGLTVIANAPNPAGYGILAPAFGKEGISPLRLIAGAFMPTIIAGACFWLL